MRRERVVSAGLFVAGLGLALLGQHYFSSRRLYARDGILLWGLAALCFGSLAHRLRAPVRGEGDGVLLEARKGARAWRAVAAAGGAILSLVAGAWARNMPPEADFSWPLWVWLVGVLSFILAFAPLDEWSDLAPRIVALAARIPAMLRRRRAQRVAAALGLLLLTSLLVRAVGLEHIPRNLGGDEGTWGVEGLAMLANGLANPFATRWFSFPSMSFLAWGVGMRVFGQTVAGLRALSALIGTSTVLVTFLLADELWDRRTAWFAAALLACGHFHLHFSRLAVNNIADGLIVTLALWLVARGLRTGRRFEFALAGAVVGVGWYAYFGARLTGVIVTAYILWQVASRRCWRKGHKEQAQGHISFRTDRILVLAGAALVVAAPLLFHYAAHPEDLNARSRQVSIFASGWLAQEQVITGRTAASLLLEQTWKAISAFNYTLDPTFWYHASIPLLDSISGVLFVAGLLWAALRFKEPANATLMTWWALAVFAGWVITENPPSSMRLVIVAPALALLAGLGLAWVVDTGRSLLGGSVGLWRSISALTLAAIAGINLHYYFVVYTPTRVYGNPTAEVTTELARQLVRRGDGCIVYFHGAPFIYWDFGTLRFLARSIPGVNVPPLGEGESESPAIDLQRDSCFVFVPERIAELDGVRAQFPAGVEERVYSDADGRLLYVLYRVPAVP